MPRSRAASASSATAQRARRRSSTSCRPERPRRARRWPRWCRSGSRTSASPSRRRSSGSTFRAIRSPASEASSNRSGSRRRPSSRPRGTPRACFSSGTRPGSRRRPPRAATAWRFSRSRTWTGRSRSRSSPSPTRRPPRASPRARRSWCGAGWTTARRDGSCSPTTSALSRRRSPRTAAATASPPASRTRAGSVWRSPRSGGTRSPRSVRSAPRIRDASRCSSTSFSGRRRSWSAAAEWPSTRVRSSAPRSSRSWAAARSRWSMPDALDFEEPLLELENRIAALQAEDDSPRGREEVAKLEERLHRQRQKTYASLTAWQRTQLARHPKRPHTRDFVRLLFEDFVELHGDRLYGDDSVISPEGCAAILWGDAAKAPEAAAAMRITAPDLLRLGVIDAIVPEPIGGAHRDWDAAAASLRAALRDQLADLVPKSPETLVAERYEKFRRLGAFEETSTPRDGA